MTLLSKKLQKQHEQVMGLLKEELNQQELLEFLFGELKKSPSMSIIDLFDLVKSSSTKRQIASSITIKQLISVLNQKTFSCSTLDKSSRQYIKLTEFFDPILQKIEETKGSSFKEISISFPEISKPHLRKILKLLCNEGKISLIGRKFQYEVKKTEKTNSKKPLKRGALKAKVLEILEHEGSCEIDVIMEKTNKEWKNLSPVMRALKDQKLVETEIFDSKTVYCLTN